MLTPGCDRHEPVHFGNSVEPLARLLLEKLRWQLEVSSRVDWDQPLGDGIFQRSRKVRALVKTGTRAVLHNGRFAAKWQSSASAPPQPQQCRRFEIVTLPSHREMQMRASDAPARSTLRDGVTLIYAGALPDQKFREVHV